MSPDPETHPPPPIPTPFPAPSKTLSRTIASHPTTASTLHFADKIVITVTQDGRLAHWTHVPLDISPTDPLSSLPTTTTTTTDSSDDSASSSLLPNHHLTSTTILGGTNPHIDVLAQTLATTVASALKTRDERETRTVVLGTGLDKSAGGREAFAEVVGLVLDVL